MPTDWSAFFPFIEITFLIDIISNIKGQCFFFHLRDLACDLQKFRYERCSLHTFFQNGTYRTCAIRRSRQKKEQIL